MSSGAQFVVAAYGVVLFALVVYVIVLGLRTARIAREAELLARLVERDGSVEHDGSAARDEREPPEAREQPAAVSAESAEA
jgi:hypothetical protein